MNILDTIVAQKQIEVARLPQRAVSPADLRNTETAVGGRRPFFNALRTPRRGSLALIAEVKRASPSVGLIRPDFDPVTIASTYERAGASCLSILTDEKFFQGSLAYLKAVRATVGLPLLRKDFIIDERQILEAAQAGADAILLIAAILDDRRLRGFLELAVAGGLDALVEVHDLAELDRALDAGARLIGVNNRNLKTFKVDLDTTRQVAERLFAHPAGRECLLVAESGIHQPADAVKVSQAGARAMLVGESLMRERDIAAKVNELLAATA